MTPYALQLIILAGAYVCAVCIVVATSILSIANYRSSKRIELRRSAGSRITTLENELASLQDLVTTLTKRGAGRASREKAKETAEAHEAAAETTGDERSDLEAAFVRARAG